jgi:hypothetical protein
MIDCAADGSDCSPFHIGGTPHIALVIGPRWKYWPQIQTRELGEWNAIIDSYKAPSIREVKTNADLAAAKREPAGGGSAFHLETPNLNVTILSELANFSKVYRLYNDTFTYRLNPQLSAPIVTAHTSPNCTVEWTSGNLDQFIETNKFGSRHQYDQDEYKLMSRHSKAAIVVVDDKLIGVQSYALEELPRNHCSDITFGWFSANSANNMLKAFGQNSSDLPFLVYSQPNKCRAIHKGRLMEAEVSDFLPRASKGELCGQVVFGSEGSAQVASPREAARVGGLVFSGVYVMAGLTLISFLRGRGGEGKQA